MAFAFLWRALVAGFVALVPTLAAAATIPLELHFDGRAIDPAATPDFTCFSEGRNQWVTCRVARGTGPGAWILERPEPGRYRMHVSVDESAANPRRHPGDYEAQRRFEVTSTGPDRIVDHPDDDHLVATAVDLLHYVERDYPNRLGLAGWGFDRYLRHRQRTNNCANCMVGDTSQGLARNLEPVRRCPRRADTAD